jgi:simple sugar transport system permease protein
MGLATAVAFRAGFFNLGGEGQLVLGGLAAALAALYLPLPAPLLMPAALVCSALTGALYASLAAFLQFELAVPLLISTLILNYPARYLATYLAVHRFRDISTGVPETHTIPDAARIPFLPIGTQLHAGLLMVAALVILLTLFFRRTTLGYEMRMTGLNPRFARYGGISLRRLGYMAMLGSGGLAGLTGGIVVLADFGRYVDGGLTDPLYAWTGLMAALLAGSAPFGVAIVGFFFAALQTGALGMEQATNVPHELSQILQGIIILLVVSRTTFGSSTDSSGATSS